MAKFSMAKRPAIALGAAAVAVLGAAGISQAQGGTAATTPSATTPGHHGGPGRGPGGHGAGPLGDRAAALAKALGVSTDKLQPAIKSLRSSEDRPDPKADRTAEVKALADALGSDSATITKVLEAQRPAGGPKGTPPTPPSGSTPTAPPTGTTPPTPPTGTTPGAGSYPTDKGPQGTTPGKRGDHRGLRGGGFPGGPGGGPGHRGVLGGPAGADNAALVTALAKATGKSEADVKSALTKLADARKADHEAAETAYAKKLADKLGLDASKVEDAIESVRPTPPAKGTTPAPTTPAPTTP